MDNNNKECSLGTHLNENCTAGNRSVLESFEKLDVDLLIARSGILCVNDGTVICNKHENSLLINYSFLQKKCCNPFALHTSSIPAKWNKGGKSMYGRCHFL